MTTKGRTSPTAIAGTGDELDLARIFDRFASDLLRYCASRVGQSAAEDVVAQTFLTALERRHHYDPGRGEPRPWLFGIATNLLRQHRRAEVRGLRALARTGVDPPATEGFADRTTQRLDARAAARQVGAGLAALPARQRDVLLLYAIAELSYAEIAAALDIPVGSVQSALHRARTRMRAVLGVRGGDVDND